MNTNGKFVVIICDITFESSVVRYSSLFVWSVKTVIRMTTVHWSTKCMRDLLFIFNLILIVVTFSILTQCGMYAPYSDFMDYNGYCFAFIIFIGMIILIISFLGCCGAIKQNFCMTITFAVLLILIFIIELAICVSIYVLWAEIFAHKFNELMVNYHNHDGSQDIVDSLQSSFDCCGIEDPSNWIQYLNTSSDPLPLSCCNTTRVGDHFTCSLYLTVPDQSRLYTKGCVEAFSDFISSYAAAAGGIAFGIALVQILGIVFSCHFARQIRKYKRF